MKILVVTGASGGHIFPALGFLDTLKERDRDIDTFLILPARNVTGRIEKLDYKMQYISISPLKLSLDFKNFIALFRFFKGTLESIVILSTFRPDIVVGFGSLVCIPLIIFARLFRIKTLIHEQNAVPGRANRFLARFCDRIAVSFSETQDYFRRAKSKVILTGTPLRKELVRIDKNKALDFFGFSNNKYTILVMGGSQGSHRVNLGFLRAMSKISDRSKIQVMHLAGPFDYDLLQDNYKDLRMDIRLFSFLKPMQYAYSACDLVVSRAGASTIAEIIFFELAAIIIPYPFAYKHQVANAEALSKTGSAIIIKDSQLDGDILKEKIEDFINNPEEIKSIRSCYERLSRINTNSVFMESVLSCYVS